LEPEINQNGISNSFPVLQTAHCISITKAEQLMVLREKTGVCSVNCKRHI